MPRIRIVCAGFVTAIAATLALGGAQAQTTPSEPVGKPLALLAGLRPPHESKHSLHAKTAHATHKKVAVKKTHHARIAAAHARHIPTGKIAKSEHPEPAVAATAFAEEPPPQAAPDVTPAHGWPANSVPSANGAAAMANDTTVAPPPESTPFNVDAGSNPTAVKVQTVKITAPNSVNTLDLADPAPAAAATPSDHPAVAPPQQTVLVAPVHRDADAVGSASWIAQVLAALGGAIAAGAVAWFLIGSGPVRTYG